MTGFGVDLGQFGALTDKVSGIGESISGAAGHIGGIGEGDFGHSDLNKAVGQLAGHLNESLSGLGKKATGMCDSLNAVARSYSGAEQTASSNIAEAAGTVESVLNPTSGT